MNNTINVRIKPHFNIIPHSSDHVELRKGVWNPVSYTVQDESSKGKLYKIIKDLNGINSISDIASKHQISRADIEGVLDHLQQIGVIEQAAANRIDYYVEQACPSVMQRLYPSNTSKMRKIILIGCNQMNLAIKNMLEGYFSDIAIIDESDPLFKKLTSSTDGWMYDALDLETTVQLYSVWKEYFVVFSQSSMNPMSLMKWNMIAHELAIPWIHGSIDGPFLFIGPLFFDRSGPCYQCFEKRVTMNLREHASYVKYKNMLMAGKIEHTSTSPIQLPLIHLVASHLSLEIINYLATGTGFTKNKVLSLYLPTMEIVFNEVLRLSSCPVCGPVEHRDNRQLYFDYQSLFFGEKLWT